MKDVGFVVFETEGSVILKDELYPVYKPARENFLKVIQSAVSVTLIGEKLKELVPGEDIRPETDLCVITSETPFVQINTLTKFINESKCQRNNIGCLGCLSMSSSINSFPETSANGSVFFIPKEFSEFFPFHEVCHNSLTDIQSWIKETARKHRIPTRHIYAAKPQELIVIGEQPVGAFKILSLIKVQELMNQGVLVLDPDSLLLSSEVDIQPGATIGPNVQILGSSKIESGVVIEGTAYLKDTVVKKDSFLRVGVRAEKTIIGERSLIGPFAHLREGSVLEEEVRVGNFVETKKSTLKKGVKASHLSYLGDSTIGEDTNIGAGTITCNFDGIKKSQTYIGSNVFIGSNSALVAPVSIKSGAVIGAGSVITKDVEENALALTRPALLIKQGWAKKRKAKT